jgi:hypothetical protein
MSVRYSRESEPHRLPEIPKVGQPSWASEQGILRLAFHNDKAKRRFMERHWRELREAYDALFQKATLQPGQELKPEEDKMAQFNFKYLDKSSPKYSPRMIDRLGPMISMMRESFPMLRTKRPR